MQRRPLAAAGLAVAVLASVAVAAEAASRSKPVVAPTVAYHGKVVTDDSVRLANKAIAYRGPALRFAEARTPRDAAEPTIGVTKRGTVYVPLGDFDGAGGALARTVLYMSRDGGRTFKPLNAGLSGRDSNEYSLDPYVYVDPDYGRAFNVDLLGTGTAITYTDDNGESFGKGFATVAGANDHQTLVTGVPPKGNPLLVPSDPRFPKIVYYCVNTVARIACAHSTDGGRTYVEAGTSPSQAVSLSGGYVCGSLHGHIVTDRDGRLFVPRNECGKQVLGVSEDGGLTWKTRTVTTMLGGGDPDSSVVADKLGNLYFTWYDEKHRLSYLSISRDHGATWTKPRMITPPGVYATNFPTIDVGDPGKIAIFFPGSPSDDAKDKARPWNYYGIVSTDALSADPTFVSTFTNTPGDPVHRGACTGRCGNIFDFVDVVVAPADSGRMWAPGVDACTKACTAEDGRKDNAAEGVIYRQVSGPALRGPAKVITGDTRR